MAEIDWSKKSVLKLIQLYQSHTFLWDSAHPEFRVRRKRDEAWRTISSGLRQVLLTPAEAEKKIHSLRSQFCREQRRVHTYKSLGKVYAPKWYGYRYLLFTLKSQQSRCDLKRPNDSTNKCHNVDSTSQETNCHIQSSVTNCHTNKTTQNTSKTSENDYEENTEGMTQNYILPRRETDKLSSNESRLVTTCHRDEFSTYGEYVANELRKIGNEHARSHMKHAINTILFKGLVGKFDKEHYNNALHDSKFDDD